MRHKKLYIISAFTVFILVNTYGQLALNDDNSILNLSISASALQPLDENLKIPEFKINFTLEETIWFGARKRLVGGALLSAKIPIIAPGNTQYVNMGIVSFDTYFRYLILDRAKFFMELGGQGEAELYTYQSFSPDERLSMLSLGLSMNFGVPIARSLLLIQTYIPLIGVNTLYRGPYLSGVATDDEFVFPRQGDLEISLLFSRGVSIRTHNTKLRPYFGFSYKIGFRYTNLLPMNFILHHTIGFKYYLPSIRWQQRRDLLMRPVPLEDAGPAVTTNSEDETEADVTPQQEVLVPPANN